MTEQVDDIVSILPPDQWEEVMNQKDCDIEPVFMGFMDIYKALSSIIPIHWTVIDFGAAYNPQCFYFLQHKRYIAVQPSGIKMFRSPNCEIFEMTTDEWVEKHLSSIDLSTTFAICSYVPPWGKDSMALVRRHFKNIFTYYPAGGPSIKVKA